MAERSISEKRAAHAAYQREFRKKNPEYGIWQGIFSRCRLPSVKCFKYYGARGITACSGIGTYEGFLACIGPRPSVKFSVDRINNDGGYWCGACEECLRNGWSMNMRWATRVQQRRNRGGLVWITWDGRTQLLVDWARELKIHPTRLVFRLKHWSLERAMTEPLKPDRRRKSL